MEISLNDYVKVKLTLAGKAVLTNHFIKVYRSFGIPMPDTPRDGKLKMQLWELMSVFGHQMHMTAPAMFEDMKMEVAIEHD